MSVNRTELVAQIAERADLTKAKADEALAAFQAVLVESLAKGEAVKVTGLLSVERVERAARTGRNPRTGEEIKIPAGYGVKLSAGSTLKKAVSSDALTQRMTCGARPLGRAPHVYLPASQQGRHTIAPGPSESGGASPGVGQTTMCLRAHLFPLANLKERMVARHAVTLIP